MDNDYLMSIVSFVFQDIFLFKQRVLDNILIGKPAATREEMVAAARAARAILKNAPILVLDEATAFADPENEREIQRALSALMKDKTVIIIAHRLSTIRGADKIIVLDRGSIAEQGRHDALIAADGRYRRMWDEYRAAMSWTITENKEAAHVRH